MEELRYCVAQDGVCALVGYIYRQIMAESYNSAVNEPTRRNRKRRRGSWNLQQQQVRTGSGWWWSI